MSKRMRDDLFFRSYSMYGFWYHQFYHHFPPFKQTLVCTNHHNCKGGNLMSSKILGGNRGGKPMLEKTRFWEDKKKRVISKERNDWELNMVSNY